MKIIIVDNYNKIIIKDVKDQINRISKEIIDNAKNGYMIFTLTDPVNIYFYDLFSQIKHNYQLVVGIDYLITKLNYNKNIKAILFDLTDNSNTENTLYNYFITQKNKIILWRKLWQAWQITPSGKIKEIKYTHQDDVKMNPSEYNLSDNLINIPEFKIDNISIYNGMIKVRLIKYNQKNVIEFDYDSIKYPNVKKFLKKFFDKYPELSRFEVHLYDLYKSENKDIDNVFDYLYEKNNIY